MRDEDQPDDRIYRVVVNAEGQYSIWPADRENALGWQDAGMTGTSAECLAYIRQLWDQQAPESIRRPRADDGD